MASTTSLGPRVSLTSPGVQKWGLRLLSLGAFALAWELAARSVGSLLLPTFTETMAALVLLLGAPVLWDALWVSNQAMILGFALAALAGVSAGFLMGRWRPAERFLDPYLNVLLATPVSALIPILVMVTGLGLVTRVLVVFSFAVAVITVNTRAGLRMVEPAWMEMARSFGATEWQLWRAVLLRGALPGIVTGLRLGMARAMTGMVFMELVLIALGLGRLMLEFRGSFEAASLYATVLVIVGEAVVLMRLFKWLEERAAPWTGQAVVE